MYSINEERTKPPNNDELISSLSWCTAVFFFFFFCDRTTRHAGGRISVLRTGIEPMPPAVEAQSLNHCTARVVPLFFLNLFYWSIVVLQCCVNFCCTAKWFSYTYSFSYSFPLWLISEYWILFPDALLSWHPPGSLLTQPCSLTCQVAHWYTDFPKCLISPQATL